MIGAGARIGRGGIHSVIDGVGAVQGVVDAFSRMRPPVAGFMRELQRNMETVTPREQMEYRGIVNPKVPDGDTPLFRNENEVKPLIKQIMLRTYLGYGCTDRYRKMAGQFPSGKHPGFYATYNNKILKGERNVVRTIKPQTDFMYRLRVKAEDVLEDGPNGLPFGNGAVGVFANILGGEDNRVNSSQWYFNERGAMANYDTMGDFEDQVLHHFKKDPFMFLDCVAHYLGERIEGFFEGYHSERIMEADKKESLPPPLTQAEQDQIWEQIMLTARTISINDKLKNSGIVGEDISKAPLWTNEITNERSLECAAEFLYSVFVEGKIVDLEQLSLDSVWLTVDNKLNKGIDGIQGYLKSLYENGESYKIVSLLRRDNHFVVGRVKIETDGTSSYRELDFHINKEGKISFLREI